MKYRTKYLAIVILVGVTSEAFGWGQLGHQLVGDVAQRHLTDKTRDALKEFLSDDRTLGDVATQSRENGQRHAPGTTPM